MIRNNRLKILVFIIVIILFLLTQSYINSKDDSSLGTILFLGNKNIAPIVYEEDGIARGIAVDIVRALEDKIGYRIEVDALDWVEAQNKVLAGEADALIQINPSPEREKVYDFSDELLESEFSIFRNSGDSHIKALDDLINKSIGVERGGFPYNLLLKHGGIKIVEIPSASYGFHLIKSGNLDAIVMDRWIGQYELAQSNIEGIEIVDQPIDRQYSRIAVKKGNKELLDIINTGLREIRTDSTMDGVIKDWKGKNVLYFTEEMITRMVLYTSIGIIVIILIIGTFLVIRYKKLSKKLELDVKEKSKELEEANKLLRQANMELEKISITDKLTNLYNRRYFDKTLQEAWALAKRESKPLALIMIDIDKFKNFNDTYGHMAGDKCLNKIANEIKNIINRPEDCLARYGGEEFAVILPDTPIDGAVTLAEKIREKVEKIRDYDEEIDRRVTVSLGVAAIVPDHTTSPKDLIHAADQALYQAKEVGRNQVLSYDSN